jgi:hypothetical protein
MGAAIQRRAVLDGAAGSHTHRETPGRAPRPRHSSTSAESPVSEHGPFTQRRARAQRTAKVATFGAFDLDYPVHSRTTESYGEHAEERVTGIAGPRFARAERTRDPRNKPRGTPWRLVSGSLVRSGGAGRKAGRPRRAFEARSTWTLAEIRHRLRPRRFAGVLGEIRRVYCRRNPPACRAHRGLADRSECAGIDGALPATPVRRAIRLDVRRDPSSPPSPIRRRRDPSSLLSKELACVPGAPRSR